MNTKKSLAKVFGPVLLLTATLALPVDTAQAAQHGRGRAAAHAQADQHKKNEKRHGNQAGTVRRTVEKKQVVVERHPQRHQQVVRQNRVVKRQVARQPVVKRQVVKQRVVRQPVVKRQQVVVRRPVVQRQRVIVTQPRTRVYRDDRAYYDPRYRTRRGDGADPNVFAVDGYLDGGANCLLLRDHQGRTWAMAGNTYGLEPGEHVRLYGRIVDGGACGWEGTAFDIYEVQTVWADDNHRRTFYDHLYDGPFDQNRAYEDDRYYDDQNGNRNWWDRLFGG